MPIAAGVHVSIGQTAVLVTALYLASAIAQPTAGKVAEVFGPRRVFLVGIVLVLAGGLLGGFARDLLTLLASRALIGLGTSCAYPTAMLLIRRRAQQSGMGKPPGGVLGGLQIAGIATAALGLPVGGVLVDALGWRAVFFVNVPVALIALSATLRWIPKDAPPEGSRRARDIASRIDAGGIAGFAVAMTALLMFLFSLPRPDWIMLGGHGRGVGRAGGLGASRPEPVLRRAAARVEPGPHPHLPAVRARALCVYIVLYGITQWLEAGRGFSAISTGLLLLPMTAISGVIIAPISRRNLVRGPVIAAAIACLAGSAGVLFLGSSTSIVWIIVITLAFGIAMGAGASGNQTALYTQAPADQLGTASGLLRTFGYVGLHRLVRDHRDRVPQRGVRPRAAHHRLDHGRRQRRPGAGHPGRPHAARPWPLARLGALVRLDGLTPSAAAQVMQVRAAGRAASRSAAIGRPQRSQRP